MTHRHLRTASLVGILCVALMMVAAGAAVAQPSTSARPTPTHTPTSSAGSPTTQAHISGPPADQTQPSGPPANASTGPPSGLPLESQRQGRLSFGNGTLDGRYVDASYDEATGMITSYSVNGVQYFGSIQAPGNFTASGRGAYVSLKGDGFVIAVTDSPTGLLRVHGPSMSAIFDLAPDAQATANGTRIELSVGNESAILSNATLVGGQATMDMGLFMLQGRSIADAARSSEASQAKIGEAIADGRVAARVDVMPEGADVLDFQGASVQARQSANGSHRFIVDANFTSGRAFVVDFAPGLLQAEELGVLYYDEVNGTLEPAYIQRADSLDDVLLIEAGEGPEYWHVDELAGQQIIVAVPSFSVHAFDVYAVSGTATPIIVVGIVAAVLMVGVIAVSAVRGRRED